jgi:predicted Rossmann-fold nucleotide-binding protein
MGAVSKGAADARGTVVGVTIGAFSEHVPVNEWLTHEVEATDLFARLPLICDAEAWVAFPGGVGTLSEVALCWNLVQTESVAPRPLIIVGEQWDRALKTFRELLLAEDVHFDLLRHAASAEAAFDQLGSIGIEPGPLA